MNPEWEWSTHRPIIQMVLSYFNPKYIVELGSGNFSTPLFVEHNVHTKCIESEYEWYVHSKNKYPDLDIVYHKNPGEMTIYTKIHELTGEQRTEITDFYQKLLIIAEKEVAHPSLLFVDQFNCGRTISINTLFSVFDIILYHDAQPEGIVWHSYYFDDRIWADFDHFILKSKISHTGMFIRKTMNYDFDRMKEIIQPFIDVYCRENTMRPVPMSLCHE